MSEALEQAGGETFGDHRDLPALLAMVRAVARELAARQLSGLLAARMDASDLAQSVVLELMQNAGTLQFRGVESTRALAREILTRLISDKVRALRTAKRDVRREQHVPDEHDGAAPSGASPAADPAAIAALHEQIDRGVEGLGVLTARERDVVARRCAGQSHAEIAAALGISVALSQRVLADARRRLRGG